MINLGISGITGRMGKKIVDIISATEQTVFKISCGLSSKNIDFNGIKVTNDIDTFLDSCDFVIDFSSPNVLRELCLKNIKKKLPIISGTSGLSDNDIVELKNLATLTKVFWSMNTSFGMAAMIEVVKKLSINLSDAEIEIHEKHHNKKIDSPSGTAMLIAREIAKSRNLDESWIKIDRNGKRNLFDIGISSERAGNTIGEHEVSFYFQNQKISIKHEAFDREIFASGAIKIAEILSKKECKAGFFTLENII